MKIIVANLKRRSDRWYTCLGALMGLQYPPNSIIRFHAHDGNKYESFETARAAAAKQFPYSRFICSNTIAKNYYCWSWTWYDIMYQIAAGKHGDLVLLLVDDYAPGCNRTQMHNYVDVLNKIYPINCIQLYWNDQNAPEFARDDKLCPGEKIPNTPFRLGVHASGDGANIMSPEGARQILELADSHVNAGVPNWVFYRIARTLVNTNGYYCSDHCYIYLGNRHVNKHQDGPNY